MPPPIAVQRSVKLALSSKPKLPFKAQGILSIARLIAVGQVPDVEQVKGAIATLGNPKTPMAIAQLLGGNASLKWLKAVQAMAIAQSSRDDSFAVRIDAKGMAIANQIRLDAECGKGWDGSKPGCVRSEGSKESEGSKGDRLSKLNEQLDKTDPTD